MSGCRSGRAPHRSAERGGLGLPVLLLLVLAAAFVWLLVASEALPDGPLDVVWDKSPCAECSMHVGDPAFAAQAITASGTVLYFDDPGCWFLYQQDSVEEFHAVWFHHLREDRWLPLDAVAFVPADDTPMGFGIGAVDPGEVDVMDAETARRRVLKP